MRKSPSNKYRKRPVVIEAHQLPPEDVDPDDELIEFLSYIPTASSERDGCLAIETLEGTMLAKPGDWIIRGVAGEYYPCDPEVFEKSYQPIEDTF